MSETPASTGRPMKYPYTFSAKIAQFPFKHQFNGLWLFRYWVFGLVVTFPLFYKIQKMSYTPENVARWEKIRREMFTPGGHH